MLRIPVLTAILGLGLTVAGRAQAADTMAMARAVGLLDAACARDQAATWGRPLCGPLLLGRWGSTAFMASQQAADGSLEPIGRWWRGTLPVGRFPANTAMSVAGTDWSMVVQPLPEDDGLATALLVHEQFHRIQPELALPPANPANDHLDDPVARRWMRLEWRALARAASGSGESACRHARDALAFRAARHAAFPGSDSSETLLERHEGLAEYTGQRLAGLAHGGTMPRLVRYLVRAERVPSYVRSFAYATGAAYGLLLDRHDPPWRAALNEGASPAGLLATRLDCTDPGDDIERRAAGYGDDEIVAIERHRADSLAARRRDYRRRLVEGPVFVSPPGELRFTFDPDRVFPLAPHGVVHPAGTFSGPWGSLQVEAGGALVSPDYRTVRVALPGDGVSKWTLTVAEGWRRVDGPEGTRLLVDH